MKILLNNKIANKGTLKKALACKSLSLTVEFDDENIISLTEVKRLMALYKEMLLTVKEKKARELIEGNLDFRLFNRIRNFDLTFIASINLFKFTFKKIKIQLIFNRLRKNTDEEECFFRFGQFLTAGFLAYGHEIYSIVYNGKSRGPGYFLKNLSGYLPFIYVEKETFIKLFHEPFNETWDKWWQELDFKAFEKLKDKKNKAEKIYQELRDDVIRNINESKGNPGHNLLDFFIIYLFSAVRKFHFIKRVLKNQWEKEKFKDSGISIGTFDSRLGIPLSKKGDKKYEQEIQHVFDKILDKPPAFVMLFSYFIEKFYSPEPGKDAGDDEKIKVRKELISKIFYFTNEIFYGIRELAKNIIEHSSNGRGVIIGRVLNRSDLPGLKPGMQIDEYLKGREETEFIDLIVLDDGDVGIIEKTIKNLNVLKTEFTDIPDVIIKFEKDIENLSKGNIVLPDFFNPGDIKLNYQQIRSALSLGLLIFSHHVLENHGFMMVSSPQPGEVKGLVLYENWDKRKDLKEIIPLGTFYNILFPKNLKRPPTPRGETVPFEMPSGESAFNKLFKLIRNCNIPGGENVFPDKFIDLEDRLCFVDYQLGSELRKEDIKNITGIFEKCAQCHVKKTRKILSIDLKEVSKFDPTDLFLFLAKIQMAKDVKSIIVHNAKDEMIEGIIKLFQVFKKVQFKIGSNDHFVLFYYRKKDQQVDCYYSFLLAGESWDDLSWINEKIAKTNLTEEILPKNRNDESICKPSLQFLADYCLNPLFTSEGHLLPFDVLIKRSGLTLFERNVLSDLNKPAGEKSYRGYKFEDAHMRLGSKIHLKDFFYARRIFQNSFYSLRFAYLVSQYIESNIHDWIKDQDAKARQFTIVGYGLYSELLISNATRFLKSMYPDWNIDHALIDIDKEENFVVLGGIKKDVILIIPISSTLSTSLKIEMRLRRKYQGLRVIGNPINIMIVGNGKLEDIVDNEGNVIDKTVKNYWRYLDVDKKMVIPTVLDKYKKEKFFIYLSSKWYLPLECQLCLPDNPVDEVVLFETDKISVTPSLIFELPQPKEFTTSPINLHFGELELKNRSEPKEANLTEDMLIYDHTSRGKNHYLYYVETTDFLKMNKEFIEDWLLQVKEELKKKTEIFESRVILIAPAHITNADFINLVNEIIFNDVATLLHYDQDEDYIQNLKSFFGEDITRDSYVFFIDDAVSSGRTFEKINDFVKYARHGGYIRGLDGAFVLLNRLTQDKHSILAEEVKKSAKDLAKAGFFSFIDLDVPIMINSERFCPICSERKRYMRMLPETLLDSLRILIKAKIIKLEKRRYKGKDKFDSDEYKILQWKYIDKEKCTFANPANKRNYLKRMEFVHKLYRGFSDEKVKGRIEELFKNCDSLEVLCKEINVNHKDARLTEDEKVNLIKILSYPYFVYHKEIRKYIFKIVIMELEKTIQTLLEIPGSRNLQKGDINTYRYLKFLIKRAAVLKANYLIRHERLEQIITLNDKLRKGLQEERGKNGDMFYLSKEDKVKFLENLDGFIDYYIMAVKEVIWFNESKSLILEKALEKLLPNCSNATGSLLLLTDSLKVENISIPLQFLNSIVKHIGDVEFAFTDRNYREDISKLSNIVIRYCLEDPYRSAPLMDFLGFQKADVDKRQDERKAFLCENPTFLTKVLPMILLKAFFLNEKNKKVESVQIKLKMNYILFCLCKILDIDPGKGGSFFVVKYMEASDVLLGANLFTIGHIGKKKDIYSFEWNRSYTLKMFEGYSTYNEALPLTYAQVIKKDQGFQTHFGKKIDSEDIPETRYLTGMKSFLFVRIANNDLDSTAKGVFVFYNESEAVIPPENLRYALILKNDVYDFLEKNYENYSFKLWVENEKIDEFYGVLFHRIRRNIINPLQQRKIFKKDGTEDLNLPDVLKKVDEKLKSYVKILSKYKEFKIESVQFSRLFNTVIEDFKEFYKSSGKSIIYKNEVGEEILRLKVPVSIGSQLDGDRVLEELFVVLFSNILENAFAESSGKADVVEVKSLIEEWHGKNYLLITAEDKGVGIAKKQDVLYDPVPSKEGLGLGLKIIRQTVEVLLEGSFELFSLEDRIAGVLVKIKIPIQQEEN